MPLRPVDPDAPAPGQGEHFGLILGTNVAGPAYASYPDVQSLDVARVIGAQGNPTATQVQLYCELVAAEIDAILRSRGYDVPVPTAAEGDRALLRKINAEGAFAMMEKASPSKPNDKEVTANYQASLKLLADARDVLESPQDQGQSEPRGPGITTPRPSNDPQATRPFFTRDMHF